MKNLTRPFCTAVFGMWLAVGVGAWRGTEVSVYWWNGQSSHNVTVHVDHIPLLTASWDDDSAKYHYVGGWWGRPGSTGTYACDWAVSFGRRGVDVQLCEHVWTVIP